jgi:glutamate formiminotransferase
VPLADTDMTACIDLSRSVGARIGTELGVPVFLYERSAMSEDRRRLESIRRGGFEGLAARMALPEWHPDFGAATPHTTAGATAVGARRLLIAWNLDLDCSRLDVAREIAAAVRERGGGLPSVKAMGVLVAHRGVVQVSMNLTDYTKTSMDVLYTRVVDEAQRRGTSVRASEIIGLVPREALVQAAARAPQLWEWHRDQILEDRIAGRVGG